MIGAMTALSLLFAGACARVVDENPSRGERRAAEHLRPWPNTDGDPVAAIPIGARVQVLYGPRRGHTAQGATAWWIVRVLTGVDRDRVGWMAEMAPGTESYHLREVPCPAEEMV
jgi:hypothetical protein